MNAVLAGAGVLALVVSASSLVLVAVELRGIRRRLDSDRALSGRGSDWDRNPIHVKHHHPGSVLHPGFAVFVYRRGRWELESDLSAPGYEPSAPSIAGAYEGQVIKKESRMSGS